MERVFDALDHEIDPPKVAKIGVMAFAGIFTLSTILGSFETIDAGERGITVRFGKVVSESMPEGLYFKTPFIDTIYKFDTKVNKNSIEEYVYTKDVQQAKIVYTVSTSLSKDYVVQAYKNYGVENTWFNKVVPQIVSATLKEEFGKWEAVDVISKREVIAVNILTNLKEKLTAKGVVVSDFSINNIDYSDVFEQAVEAKVTAAEKAKQVQNETVRVTEQAKQKVISTQGEADSVTIAAKAEAEAMRIKAQAIAENQKLLQYEAIQKWDGKLPTYSGGNTPVPFLNINN